MPNFFTSGLEASTALMSTSHEPWLVAVDRGGGTQFHGVAVHRGPGGTGARSAHGLADEAGLQSVAGRRRVGHALHRHACAQHLRHGAVRHLAVTGVHAAQPAGCARHHPADDPTHAHAARTARRRCADGSRHRRHALQRHAVDEDAGHTPLRPADVRSVHPVGGCAGHGGALGEVLRTDTPSPAAAAGQRQRNGAGDFRYALCGHGRCAIHRRGGKARRRPTISCWAYWSCWRRFR